MLDLLAAVEYGTTIRFYDPARDVWEITWITPVQRVVRRLQARPAGDDILLTGVEPDGTHLRWSLQDIAADRFTWRGAASHDGGATWREDERMLARRVR